MQISLNIKTMQVLLLFLLCFLEVRAKEGSKCACGLYLSETFRETQTIEGKRYSVRKEPIAHGATSTIYHAMPVEGPKRCVAVKEVDLGALRAAEEKAGLVEEYWTEVDVLRHLWGMEPLGRQGHQVQQWQRRTAQRLPHDRVIELFGVEYVATENEEKLIFALELGTQSLRERWQQLLATARGSTKDKDKLGVSSHIEKVLKGTLEALCQLHRADIIHLDLKPDNLVHVDGKKGEVLKLIDFGNSIRFPTTLPANKHHENVEVKLHKNTGSIAFMSPEQLDAGGIGERQGAVEVSQKSDIWSFGVLAFFLLNTALGRKAKDFPFETLAAAKRNDAFYEVDQNPNLTAGEKAAEKLAITKRYAAEEREQMAQKQSELFNDMEQADAHLRANFFAKGHFDLRRLATRKKLSDSEVKAIDRIETMVLACLQQNPKHRPSTGAMLLFLSSGGKCRLPTLGQTSKEDCQTKLEAKEQKNGGILCCGL